MEGHGNLGRNACKAKGSDTSFEHMSFELVACPLLHAHYQKLVKGTEMVELANVAHAQSLGMRSSTSPMSPLDYCWSLIRNCPSTPLISRQDRDRKILRYLEKKRKRVYSKRISYDCRKRVADNRLRVKGRFISKKEEKDIAPSAV